MSQVACVAGALLGREQEAGRRRVKERQNRKENGA